MHLYLSLQVVVANEQYPIPLDLMFEVLHKVMTVVLKGIVMLALHLLKVVAQDSVKIKDIATVIVIQMNLADVFVNNQK